MSQGSNSRFNKMQTDTVYSLSQLLSNKNFLLGSDFYFQESKAFSEKTYRVGLVRCSMGQDICYSEW